MKRKKNVWNNEGDISESARSVWIICFKTIHNVSNGVIGVQCKTWCLHYPQCMDTDLDVYASSRECRLYSVIDVFNFKELNVRQVIKFSVELYMYQAS